MCKGASAGCTRIVGDAANTGEVEAEWGNTCGVLLYGGEKNNMCGLTDWENRGVFGQKGPRHNCWDRGT